MKNRTFITAMSVCAAVSAVWGVVALAGSLDPPPGAPAPTMKTLVEVEPRIAIGPDTTPGDANSIFKITAPGSYYLTGEIVGEPDKHGVEIASGGVSIDLMGFAVTGVPDSLDGLHVSESVENVRIHGGVVRDWGANGVMVVNATNASLRDLLASNNGFLGLAAGSGSVIESCVARSNGNTGIFAFTGSAIIECVARSNGGAGVAISGNGTIRGCTAISNGGHGIALDGGGGVISGCTAADNDGDGIWVWLGCHVYNNVSRGNGAGETDGAGVRAAGTDNRIEGNNVTSNDFGVAADTFGNIIIRNTASGNGVNYEIVANNKVGVIVAAPNSGAISGSTGGAGLGTTDPWANFSY